MSTKTIGLLFAALLTAASSLTAEVPAPMRFGDAIADDSKVVALSEAVSRFSAGAGEQVFSGRVGQVCQKKGCWMTLTDGDSMARVMTDYKFALPKDLSGNVIVVGTLEAIDLDEKEAAHMAKDAGKDVSELAMREYRIAARGVAMR